MTKLLLVTVIPFLRLPFHQSSLKKRLPKKRKIFVVIHNISNNNDMKNTSGIEGVNDKTEGTFNSTSSYKKEDDDFIEELLPPDVFIDIPKPLLNEDNDLDVIFSNL